MALGRDDDTAERLTHLLAEFRDAMLTTRSASGFRSRPMRVADRSIEPEDAPRSPRTPPRLLTFITRKDSPLSGEVRDDPSVGITMQDELKFVSLAGRAEMVKDRSRLEALWDSEWDAWFPKGAQDPQAVLIDCHIDHAEYWDSSGVEGFLYTFETGRARLTGEAVDRHRTAAHAEFGAS